eukprot:c41932_g1_i1 orf=52-333(+)
MHHIMVAIGDAYVEHLPGGTWPLPDHATWLLVGWGKPNPPIWALQHTWKSIPVFIYSALIKEFPPRLHTPAARHQHKCLTSKHTQEPPWDKIE